MALAHFPMAFEGPRPSNFPMALAQMNDIELFVEIAPGDEAHDVVRTSFPSPKYYSRGMEKIPESIWLLHPGKDPREYLFSIKAAMGRELVENPTNKISNTNRALEDWDSILDAESDA